MLHVAQISFYTDPQGRAPSQLLTDWPTLVDIAEMAAHADAKISVIQASLFSQHLRQGGIDYHFLPFGHSTCALADPLNSLLHELRPDVLHVSGLSFVYDTAALAATFPDIPILIQDHADRSPHFWRLPAWRRGLAVASGIAFCSLQQAAPFCAARLIQPHTRLYEIPESTSRFTPGPVAALEGSPAVLWVGHLNANKDPLTVLRGIAQATEELPNLQLWCCFGSAPLLPAVQRCIVSDSRLTGRVHLLGRVPHDNIQTLMRAADIFVLGSHREGSGYSLIEAMACGLPPVVTDIPSFRTLTRNGEVGALWPCGDAEQFRQALVKIASWPPAPLRAAVRAHFDRELSFEAVGRKWVASYQDLLCPQPTAGAMPQVTPTRARTFQRRLMTIRK